MNKLSAIFFSVLLTTSTSALADSPDLRFEDIYNKPFYQKSWFIPVTVTVTAAGVAAVTTLTAGTGAPAAVAGASSVASMVAGGGAGSYMAGLSIIGGWVGGNAIAGAAILNAAAAAIGGTTALKVIAPGAAALIAASGQIASYALEASDSKGKQLIAYNIPLHISGDIGSSNTEELIEEFQEAAEDFKDKDITQQQFNEAANKLMISAGTNLSILSRRSWSGLTPEEQEDYIANLLILAQFPTELEAFLKYASRIEAISSEQTSFVFYLKGFTEIKMAALEKDPQKVASHYKEAIKFAKIARRLEPQAIEPVMLEMIAYDGIGEYDVIVSLQNAVDEFKKNHYSTPNSKATAYTLFGDISRSHGRNDNALHFYKLAWDETGYFNDDVQKGFLCVKLANAYHATGDTAEGRKFYEKAIDYVDDAENAPQLRAEVSKIWNTN